MDLINIFRAFHPKAAEYTDFSSAHGMFSRIAHLLGHKISLNNFKKIEILSTISSDHKAMKLEIKYKNTEKCTKTWKPHNMLSHNEWVNNEIKEEIKRYFETKENEETMQNLWDTGKAILRGKYIALQIYLKKQEAQINNLTLKATRKRTQTPK